MKEVWMKNEWRMNEEWGMMKDEGWMMNDEGFKMLRGIASWQTDRLTDKQTNGHLWLKNYCTKTYMKSQ